ncbi:MAG: peptidoglycan synthetase, partial [Bacteroidia bacterium]
MNPADKAIVFFSEGVFEHKKMPVLSAEYVAECFGNVDVITDKNLLEKVVRKKYVAGANVLLMSSGTFSGATLTWD